MVSWVFVSVPSRAEGGSDNSSHMSLPISSRYLPDVLPSNSCFQKKISKFPYCLYMAGRLSRCGTIGLSSSGMPAGVTFLFSSIQIPLAPSLPARSIQRQTIAAESPNQIIQKTTISHAVLKIIHPSKPTRSTTYSPFFGGNVSWESINLETSKSGNSHFFNASVSPALEASFTHPQNP